MKIDENGNIINEGEENGQSNLDESWGFAGEPEVVNPSPINPATGEPFMPNAKSHVKGWDRLKGGGTVPNDGSKHYMTVAGFTYEIKRCKCVLCDIEFGSPMADKSLGIVGLNMKYSVPSREVGKLCSTCWDAVYIQANVEANVEEIAKRKRFIEIMGNEAGISSEESLNQSKKLQEKREKLQEQQWEKFMAEQNKNRE